MSNIALRAHNLGKRYKVASARDKRDTIREVMVHTGKSVVKKMRTAFSSRKDQHERTSEFWALRGVELDVYWGEVLGIVGPNGSGKSTLLKILSRITEPTEGRVEVYDKVTSLLEVGTGFHPEMTGRENVFMNAIMLGMPQKEVNAKLEAIADFAEIGDFLDEPVKRYSSGMHIRLAFSVAVHMEPRILLLDEVLAVGDISFQRKSMSMVQRLIGAGRAVILVSHSLNNITEMCRRAILINSGEVACRGTSQEVVGYYSNRFVPQAMGKQTWDEISQAPGNEKVRIKSAALFVEGKDKATPNMEIGRDIIIELEYWNTRPGARLFPGISIRSVSGQTILTSANNSLQGGSSDPWHDKELPEGLFRSVCRIPGYFLKEGQYTLSVLFGIGQEIVFEEQDLLSFHVFDLVDLSERLGSAFTSGTVIPRLDWESNLVQQG